MIGVVPPPCAVDRTCHGTSYTWASPHAPLQLAVICVLIALVFLAWIAFAEKQVKDSDE